ncbi:hypothetical protein SAMN04487820_105271 [Actinopolyspora mzabensis]|uniref:Guanylate cyclase domain-containing protein n=1 Tax=Actinopolyspora mzabensis TaxID=995066 RepID=A0A1G9A251_ACTMZ|nr:hypothetical protein [Actinopolyspora mzabensis]SDK21432.1 hypothetical protein SAMN04487820_105271 [Actinopolyspora mzabensis]
MDLELPTDNRSIGEQTGILAVDVRHFSRHNDVQQKMIAEQWLPDVLGQAASRAGIAELWRGHWFRAFRGDGYLLGFSPDLVAAVVDRFFDSLQAELRRRAAEVRAAEVELRLRTSLHLGPAQSFEALVADSSVVDSPSGKVMVDTGRMVDAAPVRSLLDHSDPNVTLVASVLSQAVMEHVVRAGRTTRQHSEFVEAPLEIDSKDYAGTGYLRAPVPSGVLLNSGLLHGQPTELDSASVEERETDVDGGDVSNVLTGNAGKAVQTRDVHGGIHDTTVREVSRGVAATDNGLVSIGRDLDQSTQRQEFSGQFHTSGDSNFGPASGRRGENGSGEG